MNEAKRLSQNRTGLNKVILFENKNQQILIKDIVDWERELKPFCEIDLNNALSGSFITDSIIKGDSLMIRYVSKDSKMELRKVLVYINAGCVNELSFEFNKNNTLYHSSKTLTYKPDSGYTITGLQHVNYISESPYSVRVKWLD